MTLQNLKSFDLFPKILFKTGYRQTYVCTTLWQKNIAKTQRFDVVQNLCHGKVRRSARKGILKNNSNFLYEQLLIYILWW